LPKQEIKYKIIKGFLMLISIGGLLCFSACSPSNKDEVDLLNEKSYAFHYRNLDSTYIYARKAFSLSDGYPEGKAEALNNLAFVSTIRMNYRERTNF